MHVFVKYLSLCISLRDLFVKDGSLRHRWKTTFKFGAEAFTGSKTEKISELDKLCADAHQECHLAFTNALLRNAAGFHQALDNLSETEKRRWEAATKNEKLRDLEGAKRDFLKWLKHVPTVEDLEKRLGDQLEGTCEWVEDDELISSWLRLDNRNSSLLWISGGPGTGKTILSAHIIKQLQDCHPTAYFFCKSDDQEKQTTTAVLQNWIWQLVHDLPVLPESVTSPSDKSQSPSTSVLAKTVLELQQHLKRSYLIVDGLDECVDNDVTDFLQCCRMLSKKWSVLIISRDIPDIRNGFKNGTFGHKVLTTQDNQMDINSLVIQKAISIEDTKEDIDKFVSQRTEELAMTKSWQAMQNGIANVLSANAEGMFLWVRLVLDFLLDDATLEGDIEDALASIPSDLNGFYGRIVENMKAQSSRWRITQRALHWIVYAFRPLTVEELHAAIACEFNSSRPINNFELILRGGCGLLIRIDQGSRKITLIHATVKEYLLKASAVLDTAPGDANFAHAQLSTICLLHLCTKVHESIYVTRNAHQSEQRFQTRFNSNTNHFLDYSAIYWCQHLHKSAQQSTQWQSTLHRLLSSEELVVNWLQLFQYLHAWGRPGTLETAEILHLALHPQSKDVSLKDMLQHEKLSSFQTHLGLADGKRYIRWDWFLHAAGNFPAGLPVILIAAHFNFVDVVKRELRRRVDIETEGRRGGTALLWAARGGSSDTIRYLLSRKAGIDHQSHTDHQTALAKAIFQERHLVTYPGTYPVVEILLEAGANPELRDQAKRTLLNFLVDSNNTDGDGETSVVKLLLKHSPQLWKDDHPTLGSILHHAILQDKPRIAGAILEEIRVQDPGNAFSLLSQRFQGAAALNYALQNKPHVVPVLLEHGADVNTPDARGVLPIQAAAQQNLGPTLKALIERGCSVDTEGQWCQSPLVIALENQSMEAASVLLDMGANTEKVPESLILLPRTTTLDNRIQAMKPADTPWPLGARDIYQLCFHFKEVLFVPIPITARIIDMAELWVQSSVTRADEQVYDMHSVQRTYLRSAAILGRNTGPLQRITYTITSHDQGFDSNKEEEQGNWTWFESQRLSGEDFKKVQPWISEPMITHNRHANPEWYTQHITQSGSELQGWDRVKPGDRISVVACAFFPAWRNFVSNMRIDVFTSVLRRHYTRNEISEIWDTPCERYLHESDTFEKAVSKPERPLLEYMSSSRSRLQILAATFCDFDVTNIVAELVMDGLSLELDTNSLEEYCGFWRWLPKTFSLLYQFSNSDEGPQLLITTQPPGTVSIESSTAGLKAGSIPKPLGAAVHILAIVYGKTEITAEDVYERMYTAIAQDQAFMVSNDNLGGDNWVDIQKSCAVYYRQADGSVRCSAAKEGGQLKFEV